MFTQYQKNDEYYTPAQYVKKLLPYLPKSYKNILSPFDKKESKFVSVLSEYGLNVAFSHIETEDFFSIPDQTIKSYDCIISNPPFSLKTKIIKRLYLLDMPFALLVPFNSLFDNLERYDLLKDKKFAVLLPRGRWKFSNLANPPFQSCYLTFKFDLNERIILIDDKDQNYDY